MPTKAGKEAKKDEKKAPKQKVTLKEEATEQRKAPALVPPGPNT